MKKVRVGIVGFGTIAKKIHLPVLSSFKDVEIACFADKNREELLKHSKKFNAKVFEDYKEMIEKDDLDAVFICLPNHLHYDAVKTALENSIHVFCEKPMGTDALKAAELVKLAKKKDLVLAVGYNRRLEENYQKAAKFVRSRRLGQILQVQAVFVNPGPYASWIPSSDWFFEEEYGVLYDSAPHLIDLIMYVLDDRISEVKVKTLKTIKGFKAIDTVAGVFKTEKGYIGTFNVGWKSGASFDAIYVYGTGCAVFANNFEFEIRHGSYTSLDRLADHIRFAKKIIVKLLKRAGGRVEINPTYFKEDRAFIDAVKCGNMPLVTGEDALRVLEVLEAIRQSIDKGREIDVKFNKV